MQVAIEPLRKKFYEWQLDLMRLDDDTKNLAGIIGDAHGYYVPPYGLWAKRILGYSFTQTQQRATSIDFVEDTSTPSVWDSEIRSKIMEVLKN